MSDHPNGPPGSRASSRKRRAPTIDLSAEEVKSRAEEAAAGPPREEPAAAETAAEAPPAGAEQGAPQAEGQGAAAAAAGRRPPPQPAPQPAMPSAFALPPRFGPAGGDERGGARRAAGFIAASLAGGALALAGLVLVDRAGLVPLTDRPGQVAALGERLATLEEEQAAARQAGELGREDLQAQLADLDQLVAALAAAAPADPPPAEELAALAELGERLTLLEGLPQRVDELAEQVAAIEALEGAVPAERDVTAVERQVAGLGDRLGDLEEGLSGLAARLDAAAPAEALADVEAQLAELSRQAERAAALAPAVAADALAAALAAGRPFAAELRAIRGLGVDDPAIAQLEPYAAAGLPDRAALARQFRALVPQIAVEEAPPPAETGPLERLLQSARNIVEIRPAGPREGDEPAAVASRIEAALDAGDLAGALEEWQDLPPQAQAASEDWADRLRAVLAGQALAQRLRGEALARLAPQD